MYTRNCQQAYKIQGFGYKAGYQELYLNLKAFSLLAENKWIWNYSIVSNTVLNQSQYKNLNIKMKN